MRTIAVANASHGFSDVIFGFFLRNRLAGGINFSKILPQFVRDFQSSLMGDCDRLEGTDADRFVFLNPASQKSFDSGLLVGRKIFGIADHAIQPHCIMTDCIPKISRCPDASLPAGNSLSFVRLGRMTSRAEHRFTHPLPGKLEAGFSCRGSWRTGGTQPIVVCAAFAEVGSRHLSSPISHPGADLDSRRFAGAFNQFQFLDIAG